MTTNAGSAGTPRFDVVLRGYDRRQVDEHVAHLQNALGRMQADLELVWSQSPPGGQSPAGGAHVPGQQGPPAGRPRATPPSRYGSPPPLDESPDMIGNFSDRMQSILQAAEEEAAEIRNAARADEEKARAHLADLVRQRDAMFAELYRMRGQLDGLLAAPPARSNFPPREGMPPVPRTTWDSAPGAAPPGPARPGPGVGQQPGGAQGGARSGGAPPGAPQATGPDRGTFAPKPRPDQVGPSAAGHGGSAPDTFGWHGVPPGGTTQGDVSPGGSISPAQLAAGQFPADQSQAAPLQGTPADPRIPADSYPATGEQSGFRRTSTQPAPEPAELFRPAEDAEPRATAEP